jgi:hypothetical protein
VWRSADGGKTFQPTTATTPPMSGMAVLDEVSIAVDAGNPDIVYVAFEFSDQNGLAGTLTGDYSTPCPTGGTGCGGLGLFVSKDAGATFSFVLLEDPGGTAGDASGPDVVSPAPNVVIVSAPSDATTPGDIGDTYIEAEATGFSIFSDATNGAGIVPHAPPSSTTALADAGTTYIQRSVNTGETTDTTHMFYASGVVCVSYVAVMSTALLKEPRVRCSTDNGKTFGAEIKPLADAGNTSNGTVLVNGALSFDATTNTGMLAVSWGDETDNTVHVATAPVGAGAVPSAKFMLFSTGTGTLPAPAPPSGQSAAVPMGALDADVRFDEYGALWLAYETLNGDLSNGIAIDKSCDGQSWSGAMFANLSASQTIDNAQLPGFVRVSGGMALSARGVDPNMTTSIEKLYRLIP